MTSSFLFWRKNKEADPSLPVVPNTEQGIIGIRVLSDVTAEATDRPIADIIAVHGLAGDAVMTWTHPKTGKMWLRDFLPGKIPNARIMTYGYQSDPRSGSVLGIMENAEGLLEGLKAKRIGFEKRPVIFIGHSLGGLVIKKALLKARDQKSPLFDATFGIMFMSIPHNGADAANFAVHLTSVINIIVPLSKVNLKELTRDSRTLADLSDQFGSIQDQFEYISVFESRKTVAPHLPRGILVVPPSSARLNLGAREIKFHIGAADHHQVCKFASADDHQYETVWVNLQQMVKNALPKLRPAPDLIFNAAAAGDEMKVQECLRNGIDVGSKNRDGLTALHLACATSHGNVVKVLLKEGADVHALSGIGQTPLYHAAQKGHIDIVELLLEYGADVEFSQWNAWAPIHTAAYNGRIDMVKFLVEKGAKIEAKACDGQTALKLARLQENQALVDILQYMGAQN